MRSVLRRDALAVGTGRGLERLRSRVAHVGAMRGVEGRAALVGEGRHYEVGCHCVDGYSEGMQRELCWCDVVQPRRQRWQRWALVDIIPKIAWWKNATTSGVW